MLHTDYFITFVISNSKSQSMVSNIIPIQLQLLSAHKNKYVNCMLFFMHPKKTFKMLESLKTGRVTVTSSYQACLFKNLANILTGSQMENLL